jgi:bacteriorhodopsin
MGICCLLFSFSQIIATAGMNTVVLNGRTLCWSKFLDWCVSCPLLTACTAMSYDAPKSVVLNLGAYTFSFCICGLGAALVKQLWIKIVLTVQGCFVAAFVIYELWRISRNPVKPSRIADMYLYTTMITWPVFTLTWMLGPDVFFFLSQKHEYWLETCLSMLIKSVGFCYAFSEEEYLTYGTQIWELPGNIFSVARSVLLNMLFNRH